MAAHLDANAMQVLGMVGIMFLLFTGRLAFHSVVGFCIALSNAFGLIAGKGSAFLTYLH